VSNLRDRFFFLKKCDDDDDSLFPWRLVAKQLEQQVCRLSKRGARSTPATPYLETTAGVEQLVKSRNSGQSWLLYSSRCCANDGIPGKTGAGFALFLVVRLGVVRRRRLVFWV